MGFRQLAHWYVRAEGTNHLASTGARFPHGSATDQGSFSVFGKAILVGFLDLSNFFVREFSKLLPLVVR